MVGTHYRSNTIQVVKRLPSLIGQKHGQEKTKCLAPARYCITSCRPSCLFPSCLCPSCHPFCPSPFCLRTSCRPTFCLRTSCPWPSCRRSSCLCQFLSSKSHNQ